jgi:hypothetical protein
VLPPAAELLQRTDDLRHAVKTLSKQSVEGASAALLWTYAVGRADIFMASAWPQGLIEDLHATPLASVDELQRLIDAAHRVLILPDADKIMAEVS